MTGNWRPIGVIGGMGPLASADFITRLVLGCGATRDCDYPRLLLDSNPHVPDRNAARHGGASPGPALAAMARGLVAQGAQVLAMPCNAAHGWADAIIGAIAETPAARFVNLVDAAVARVLALGARRVGVLGVAATLDAGLYHRPLQAAGIEVLEPEREAFGACIEAVKAGRHDDTTRAAMAAIAGALAAQGADVLIAACTEVPLILTQAPVPLVDATDALVNATLAAARIG
ncbi:amino acid racemase [Polymorphobacter arshaanensis]|uniref:Amino acid racemase n=1 Tax=Glacieibacterium arshaanense TaxID=2511025 RepID=A0A4Y9ELW7_9SPHN|nr:amino acid racemase [Polymorphobacter arshaanensis]TFU01370.1 amino acid racemase [Polymorphobacter arshaanensis]